MPSSHIKGKGKRRMPGRPGGAKKTARRPSGTRKRSGSRKRTAFQSAKLVCHWWEVETLPLSGAYKDHPWVFIIYEEWNRPDGQPYLAFLFRNQQRTVFGIHEWLGERPPLRNTLPKMAYRVVTDAEYRKKLVSDDPDLPEMWKKH